MALVIEGRISKILPIETGVSQKGNEWKKRIFVISTLEQYPREVAFVTWNEKAEALDNLKPGMRVSVQFSLESREFNDRWYTDARAFAIKVIEEKDVTQMSGANAGTGNMNAGPQPEAQLDEDPFNDVEDDIFGEENATESDDLFEGLDTEADAFPEDTNEDSEDIFKDKDGEDDLPF